MSSPLAHLRAYAGRTITGVGTHNHWLSCRAELAKDATAYGCFTENVDRPYGDVRPISELIRFEPTLVCTKVKTAQWLQMPQPGHCLDYPLLDHINRQGYDVEVCFTTIDSQLTVSKQLAACDDGRGLVAVCTGYVDRTPPAYPDDTRIAATDLSFYLVVAPSLKDRFLRDLHRFKLSQTYTS